MTWIMKTLFVALAVLFLWQVEKGAEACSCLAISPKDNICRSDVVLRAYILGSEEVYSGTVRSTKYNIYTFQVFRGPNIDAIYTSGPCRVFLDEAIRQDYLLTGQLNSDGTAQINLCNFKKPWSYLSADELRLIQNLDNNCG